MPAFQPQFAAPVASLVAPAAQQAAPAEPAEEEKPPEKTEFKVKLEKFNAESKAKIIREIKALIPGSNLVEVGPRVRVTVLCPNRLLWLGFRQRSLWNRYPKL